MTQTAPTAGSDTSGFLHYADRIRKVAAEKPDLEAIKCDGAARRWADFLPRINQVANMLAANGLGRGNMVAILAKSSIEYMEVFLGALQAGVCTVPLSGMASSEQLEMMVRDSGSKLVFASRATRDLIEPFRDRVEGVPADGFIAFDFDAEGWTSFETWIESASREPLFVDIQPTDAFNLIYSSGTTGVPKGIVQSQQMRAGHVRRFHTLGPMDNAVTLISTALYSNTTLVMLLPTLAMGGRVVIMSKFDVKGYLELAEQEKVTHTMLVPVQYQRLLAHPDFDSYDLSAFEVKFCTSAPLREGVKRDILDRWPGGMFENYGLTEGGVGTILACHEHPDKLGSVGRASEGVDIRILNEEGVELPQGEIGEIVGRSGAMMTGYHGRPDLTEAMIWRSAEGDIFYKSGDMGRFDAEGFLFLLDRKKDMIISGGFNIYASDIEVEISKHRDVADVAVIGVPSAEWGETPLALVVPKEGRDLTEAGLMDWVNGRLGKAQRISGVEFRADLPRSTIGKIMKRELREPYWAQSGHKI